MRFTPSTSVSPPSASFHHNYILIVMHMLNLPEDKLANPGNLPKGIALYSIRENLIEKYILFFSVFEKV